MKPLCTILIAGCLLTACREPEGPQAPTLPLSTGQEKQLLRGVLVGESVAEVVLPIGGALTALPENGSLVRKGQVLFQIEQDGLDEEIELALDRVAQAELDVLVITKYRRRDTLNQEGMLELDRSQLKHDQLGFDVAVAGLTAEERRVLDLDIDLATLALEEAQDDLEAEERLVKRGFLNARSLDPLLRARDTAATRLEETVLRKKLALRPLPEEEHLRLAAEVRKSTSKVARAEETWQIALKRLEAYFAYREAQLKDANRRLKELERRRNGGQVESPADGVLKIRLRLLSGIGWDLPMLGTQVSGMEVIADIIDPTRMSIVLAVHQRDAANLHVGQPVLVHLPAHPDRWLRGTVEHRAEMAQDRNRIGAMGIGQVPTGQAWFSVQVDFDAEGLALHPGMSAVVEILSENHHE